jgi:hypothetical protein
MRSSLLAALGLVAMMVGSAAANQSAPQGGTTSNQKADEKAPKPPSTLTISGCVSGGRSVGDPFTLVSDDGSIAYKLSGKNMKQYLGRRVTIVGSNDTRRLKIVGGLYPSPNAAAQAGAMNGAQTAIAADPLSTAAKNDQQLPEFRVKSVQASGASCR